MKELQKTESGIEVFGDYDTNTAQGYYSTVFGKNNVSGCKGYYIQSIDLTNKKIYLSSTQQVPVISTTDNTVSAFMTPQYSVGDYFCVINDSHYIYKATIKSVQNNVVVYDGDLGFSKISGTAKDPHDFSFFVPTRPLVGVAVLTTRTFVIGYNSICAGRDGIAVGNSNVVAGNGGITLGSQCIAGYIAFAFGFRNKSLGTRSASFGSNNESLGNNSFTTGEENVASGTRSHAEGYKTKALSENAHAEGYNTQAIGSHAHTEGHTTEAKYCAHAEGHTTKAHGNYSHTEGQETETLKAWAHAEGYKTISDSYAGHAEGYGTKVTTDYAHVQGKWNEIDTEKKYVHLVGWGSSDTDRKNIHTLDTNGNAWYKGDVVGNGISLATVNSNEMTAKTNASTAIKKATNAESTANTAQTTANNANTKASNAEKKVAVLEEYSGIIDIPYLNKIQPTNKAIYRVPHNYLARDGKFYDHAAIYTVEDYTQFTIPATQMIKDSQGNDKVQYSIGDDVNQKKYYCYYNNVHYILGSDTVRSQVFNGRTYVGTVTDPEDAKENTYGVFKVYTLYMYVENVGYVRLNTDKTKGYFADRFNSPDNKPTGSFSTTIGIRTNALGYATLSGGDSSEAIGPESVAIGAANIAEEYASSVFGNHNIARGQSQSVRGKYNEPLGNDFLDIVGNGTSIYNRKNAYTLDKDGNAWFEGNVECAGVILKSPNGTRFKLTVADDGTLVTSAM